MRLLPIFATLMLISCGGGGGSKPLPTINLIADDLSVLLNSTTTLSWSSTNATSCVADWTSLTSVSGSVEVTILNVGNNNFSITCSGDGGSSSASVNIEGYRNTSGVVVDGYITGSDVYIDQNENWIKDSDENSVTSDNLGKFTLRYDNGSLISVGGSDLDSQVLLDDFLITHKLTGHTEFKVITPITSVMYFMNTASNIYSALGIDSSIDILSFDPVANKGDGGINDYLYEKGNQLTIIAYAFQNLSNDLKTGTDKTQDYFKAIAEELEKEYNESNIKVDIETEAFLSKVLDNLITAKTLTISDEAKSNTLTAMYGLLPIIQVKAEDNITTALIRFGLSTFQTDIKTIANGTASAETINNYNSNILNYIANDQSIEINDITPNVSAIADTVSTNEDTAVDINVLSNDSYITNAPISLTAIDGTNGITSITNNIITYTPNADFNGSDTFTYTINQGDKSSSADVTITIDSVNDAPVINLASTIQVYEKQTAAASNFISDADENDTLSLTLSGSDADIFNLSSDNVLTFKTAPDYEIDKKSYSITLTLTDGTVTVSKDIIINILDNKTPTINTPSKISSPENQLFVINFDATDEEGDEITFTVSDFDYESFNIDTNNGMLLFKSEPDYETKNIYKINLNVTDGFNTPLSKEITITITNVSENAFGDCKFGDCKFGK